MVRVADDYCRASLGGASSRAGQSFLVLPREIPLVVSDEAIVLVRDSVGWIAVDCVTTPRRFHDELEVCVTDVRVRKDSRGAGQQVPAPQDFWRSFTTAVGDVELASQIQPIDAAESGTVEVKKTYSALDGWFGIACPQPIIGRLIDGQAF
jgi:hypothetical protein